MNTPPTQSDGQVEPEEGWSKHPNPLLRLAMTNVLTGAEKQIINVIVRKTYGWHKSTDHLSIGKLKTMTKLSRRAVIYCLQNLEAKRIITIRRKRIRHQSGPSEIGIQENTKLWVVQTKSDQYRKLVKRQQQRRQGVVQTEGRVVQSCLHPPSAKLFAPTKETKKTNKTNKRISSSFKKGKSKTFPKEDRELLRQAKEELERFSNEDRIFEWLCRLPRSLHGELCTFLTRIYPQGHSYHRAKDRYGALDGG